MKDFRFLEMGLKTWGYFQTWATQAGTKRKQFRVYSWA